MNSEEFKKGIEEIETVRKMLEILGVDDNEYTINLKIIRGLDYYTGTVIETFLIGNENYGSICSGGRYDNLAENYTDNILPGVGISIGLTRLFFVLKEIGFLDNYKVEKPMEYLIIPIGDTLEYCVEIYKMLLIYH
ncbi:histidine--tRNA ligase [Clostridium chromiireducens]|uniref:Histidine--tRNA ligase n=1 Tax=Clostridium chromiireducens TaxID=225345 RepID=A0A1V4IP48_9CLOT|nr:histidine--tRNA ligase [Clostridium chromiireducens]